MFNRKDKMTPRIAYAIASELDALEKDYPGVLKKCREQASSLCDAGLNCQLLFIGKKQGLLRKMLKRLPLASDGVDWDLVDGSRCDIVYVRRPYYVSKDMIRCLRRVKERNPDSIIMLELSTYPYDKEYSRFAVLPLFLKDVVHRRKLHECVDRVVDLSGRGTIFGIQTLPIINGIDLSRISPRRPSRGRSSGFDIMCVAAFAEWHGIDRFLSGMKAYKEGGGSKRVRLHLLGDGPALAALKRQVGECGLDDDVVFYGQCDRERMDKVYDACCFAVECLGCHRKSSSPSSSLKSREYFAKGIPFVYAADIDVFMDDPVDFCLKAPADESPIDVEELVEFAERLYEREPEEALIGRIRKYAEKHVGMDIAMKNVIDYIKENCHDGQ